MAIDNNNLAPIVLFVYNRPFHTEKTVEALKRNALAKESELFIFADGLKKNEHKKSVEEVRVLIKSISGFKKVHIIEQEKNRGLADSVIAGVTEIVNKYGKVIVLEDDIVCSEIFLSYMNEALLYYEDKKQVFSITGHNMGGDCNEIREDTFFIKFSECWSWATWSDRWKHFDALATGWEDMKYNYKKRKAFNLDNAYPFFELLEGQIRGKVDSWAIRWQWSVFKKDGLILIPKHSIIKNIGLDNSGTHCAEGELEGNEIYDFKALKLETNIREDKKNRRVFTRNIRKQHNKLLVRCKRIISKVLRKTKLKK